MMSLELEVEWVDIDSVEPNTWNPNVQSEFIYQKTRESLLEFGWVDPATIRERDDGSYEIIDGEHRWKIGRELAPLIKRRGNGYFITIKDDTGEEKEYRVNKEWGQGKMPVINLGKIDDDTAKELTVILNNTRGEPDVLKLADLIGALDTAIGRPDLERLMPYPAEELASLIELINYEFNPQAPEPEPDAPKTKWERMLFLIPEDALPIIESELDRIGDLLQLDPSLNEETKRGLILEKICVLSAQTPTESLE